jgi:hypothetical protein
VPDPDPFGERPVGASGTVNVGSSVGEFEAASLEDEADVDIDAIVCSVVYEAPGMRDVSHILSSDGAHILTTQDEWFGFGINLFHMPVMYASSSTAEDDKNSHCDEGDTSKRTAYSWCNDGAAFRYYSEVRWLSSV